MRKIIKNYSGMLFLLSCLVFFTPTNAQLLQLPDGGVNFKNNAGRKVGMTDIEINWSAPGVKGREGKIIIKNHWFDRAKEKKKASG